MGVFTQTDAEIFCEDEESAKKVYDVIQKKQEENREDFNYAYLDMNVVGDTVYIEKSSGRTQNLRYQCEVLWKLIKDIPGVIEMNAPFMIEEDGEYFNIEDVEEEDEDEDEKNE